MKKRLQLFLFAVAFVLILPLCAGAITDGTNSVYTYNFDYWGEIMESPDAYRVEETITSASLGLDVAMESPQSLYVHGNKLYTEQVRDHILKPLAENYGVDISDEAIRAAVREHNEICKIFEEISEMRKEENPRITPREFHILCLVSYSCPNAQILPYLRETLEDLRTREADAANRWRARVVVVGSELDDYDFDEIMENARCYVAADRYCFGSIPGRQQIPLTDDEPALDQVCRYYLETNQCPRFMSHEKIQQRRDLIRDLVRDYKADGLVIEQAKFCDFWGYERTLNTQVMQEEYGIPTLGIDREYVVRGSGQLATRMQAFVESLEIKKIQKGGAE